MKVKYDLVFNRKGAPLKPSDKALIQIEAYLNGKRRYFSTGIYVTANQWNQKRRIIRNHPDAEDLNQTIRKRLRELEVFENGYAHKPDAFTLASFDELKAKPAPKKEALTFTAFYLEQLEKEKSSLQYITYSSQRNTIAVLTEYRSKILFEDLNYELVEGFNNFLLSRKLKLNSIEKYHRNIRKYINIAVKKDLFDYRKNPYRLFKVKTEPTGRTALTVKELERFTALTFTPEDQHLEPVRDMFLFASYTGLRYSDVMQIKHTNLAEEESGWILELKAIKTGKPHQLPLGELFRNSAGRSKPELILSKYHRTDGKAFFKGITNQYANRCLKLLAARARIRKKVSFHIARHSFATIMAAKVPITVLQALLQHDKLETTQIYLHMSNQIVRRELQNVKW